MLRGIVASVLLVPLAGAQGPSLDSIAPTGARRGTEVLLKLSGKRLGGAQDLLIEPAGISVLELEQEKADRVSARLRLDDDCPLGLHAVWVRTSSGLSNMRLFSVGALPVTDEVEPNGADVEPQPITLGQTLVGTIQSEDVDRFAFDGRAGTQVAVEVEGLRLGINFDSAMTLIGPRGFALATCDDSAMTRQDPSLSVVLPSDGLYVIELSESSYRGSGACHYRMHVGCFPRPGICRPLGGAPGEELDLGLVSSDGTSVHARVLLPREVRAVGGWVPPGVTAVWPHSWAGELPSPVWMRVVDLPRTPEVEPNANFGEATPAEAPTALEGVLSQQGDLDRFKLSVKKGDKLVVEAWARRLRSPVDMVVALDRASGGRLVGNDDSRGPDSFLSWTSDMDGEVILTVRDQLMRGGPDFAYRVEITRPAAGLSLGVEGERQSWSVPRAGAVLVQLRSERAGGAKGPLQLTFSGLPEGVTAEPLEIAGDLTPVLLRATGEATLDARLVKVRAATGEAGPQAVLSHQVNLVEGRNRTVFWAHSLDRLPVAVARVAPVSVTFEAPKVPLLRGGVLPLVAVVERAEGFEGDVKLSLPYLPPGVNAVRERTVKAGSDRATFELTAKGDAPLGATPLVVVARAKGEHALREIASEPVIVQLQPPFVQLSTTETSLEVAGQGEVYVEVKRLDGFPGKGTVQLVGLPHQVQTEPVEFGADGATLVLPIAAGPKSPVGKHGGVRLIATFDLEGGRVTQGGGGLTLRIQRPAPAPVAKKAVEASAKKPVKRQPNVKPPSRLEQLKAQHKARLEQRDGDPSGDDS